LKLSKLVAPVVMKILSLTLSWKLVCLNLKRIIFLKIEILSSFTYPQVVSNLYEFLLNIEDILKNVSNQTLDGPH